MITAVVLPVTAGPHTCRKKKELQFLQTTTRMQSCCIYYSLREGQLDTCRQSLQHTQTASALAMEPETG